ncbi:MAG: DUF4180 domain-containing protein, partial [Cytophagaceae bacterium]|nr:DUF4180 domain-containing protein [Cytophagaceae bacterium]
MNIHKVIENNVEIVTLDNKELLITDTQSALDLMATVRYEADCDRLILHKSNITEDFFDLKTGLAGSILQKIINYQLKLAIIGDFSIYTSKSLRDFIYEMNSGKDIFFLENEQQAIEKLAQV